MNINFYFDFISPYAYFAWYRLRHASPIEVQLNPIPVLLAGILGHWQQKGPAEIAPKRIHTYKDCYRYARRTGIPFQLPAAHPFKPLTALRLALPQVAGDQQPAIIDCLFKAIWTQRQDGADSEFLASALRAGGFDPTPLMQLAASNEAKQALRDSTESAVKLGVFGVPTMTHIGEIYWGNDQLEHLWSLDGFPDCVTPELAKTIESLPVGAVRKT